MNKRKKHRMQPEKRTVILISVGVVMAILIIIAAVLLMKGRGGDGKYEEYYSQAMEYYIDGDFENAAASAKKALEAKSTEEAVILLSRSYMQQGDSTSAIYVLESWLKTNSGSDAEALLEEYKNEPENDESLSIGGQSVSEETETLSLSSVALTSADMETLAKLTNLTALTLNDCGLSDISAVSKLTKLRSLSLNDNNITDLSPLSGLKELRTLYLSGNPAGSLEPLHSLSSLTTLDIRGREILDTELEELEKALPDCTVFSDEATVAVKELSLGGVEFKSDVTELDLSNKGITDISVLADCTALVSMNLSGNEVEDISALINMPELARLDLSKTKVSSLSPIMTLTKLQYLDVSGTEVKSLAAITGLTELTTLRLDGCKLQGLGALSGLTKLTELSLRGMDLKDSDLSSLETLTALKTLDLSENLELTGAAVDALKEKLPGCTISASEEIYGIKLGDAEFDAGDTFVDASARNVTSLENISRFKSLQTLLLNDNRGIQLSGLGTQTSLTALELKNCALDNIGELRTLTALTNLSLDDNAITDISALSGMTKMSELHLSDNASLRDISALSGMTELWYLSLGGTSVSDISVLSGLTKLETLDLSYSAVTDLSPLHSLTNLRTLDIRGCDVSFTELRLLEQTLPGCAIYS